MINEKMGELTKNLYMAEYQRMVKKTQLNEQRKTHHCKDVEYEYTDSQTGDHAMFCYRSANPLKFEDWCANCKYVEPYYQSFKKADDIANKRRYNLRRVLKRKVDHISEVV
jgi:hypothetical protein